MSDPPPETVKTSDAQDALAARGGFPTSIVSQGDGSVPVVAGRDAVLPDVVPVDAVVVVRLSSGVDVDDTCPDDEAAITSYPSAPKSAAAP